MSELQRLILEDDDTTYDIYLEPTPSSSDPMRDGRTGKGIDRSPGIGTGRTIPPETRVKLQEVHNTIQGYTQYAIGAFKNLAVAEVEELNLKFNLKISAEGGLPVLASAKTEADFSIEVKCKFKDQQPKDGREENPST